MKIVIDARWIFPELSGVGTCTRELIRQLVRLDRENDYRVLFAHPAVAARTAAETGLDRAANWCAETLPCGVFSPRSQWLLPARLRQWRADVYHSPNWMIPLAAFPRRRPRLPRAACVVTIHDVIPLLFPDHAPRARKRRLFPLYRWLMRETGRRADRIITVSRASAADTARCLGIPAAEAGKLVVVYNGVGDEFTPPPAPRPPRAARRLLYVGRADPYKNLAGLVRAFAGARARCRFPLELTIAGSPDPRYPEARQEAERLRVSDAVRWTGYLAQNALVDTYRDADLLVHPSRYEGFGLQIVEAMACGLPVACSNRGSLPEVAGGAALLFDPDDEGGMIGAIERGLTDETLRAELRERGRQRAATFRWERNAAETLAVYRAAAASGRPA